MAKSFAQSKGARGEREIINILQPIVDKVCIECGKEQISLLRNSLQSRQGGYDMLGLDWLALEIKRCETLNLNAWTEQCLAQAKPGQTPVLIYKQNNRAWKVMMHAMLVPGGSTNLKVWADISVQSFLAYFELRLKHEVCK
jgi:hypothetical protein